MTDKDSVRHTPDRAPTEPEPEPEGGEPACLLNRICPSCDAVLDAPPPTSCHRCGEQLPGN